MPASGDDEIVVPGAGIRGVAPVGAAVSTSQVLAMIPQLSDFGEVPTILGSSSRLGDTGRGLRLAPAIFV